MLFSEKVALWGQTSIEIKQKIWDKTVKLREKQRFDCIKLSFFQYFGKKNSQIVNLSLF